MGSAAAGSAVRVAVRNPLLARLVTSYASASINEWAIWLAAVVYAEQRHGIAAAGWVSLALLVPSLTAAPFVGRLLEAERPIRTLTVAHVAGAAGLAGSAVLAWIDAPVVALVVPAAVGAGAVSIIRPAYASLAPGVVRSARELTSATLIASYCDSGAALLGPLAATAAIAAAGPAPVFASCAVLSIVGAAATVQLIAHDRTARVATVDERPSIVAVVGSLRHQRGLTSLLVVLSGQFVLLGVLDVMFVAVAVDVLGLAGSGAGVLNMAFGLGAVSSGLGLTMLVGRVRLTPVIVIALGSIALSLVLLASASAVAAAVALLAVAGLAQGMVGTSSRILLQRSTAPHRLASMFALVELLTVVGALAGTVAAQIALTTVGVSQGLRLLGLGLMFAVLATARQIWRADRSADVPVVSIGILRSIPLFSPLSPAAIEAVARAAKERTFDAGDVVISEGDEGHSYFAIVEGDVQVSRGGTLLRTPDRVTGVGELALLADVPRTATVTATTALRVLEIDREPFLLAVTGNDASLTEAWQRIDGLEGIDHVRSHSWLQGGSARLDPGPITD